MNFNMLALGKEYSRSCLQPCFGHCCAKKIKNCGNELNQESDLIAKPQDRKYWRSRALRAEDKLQSLREQCLGPQASRKSRYPTVFLSTFSREMSSYPSSFPSKFPSGHPVTGSPFTGNPTTLPTEFPSLSPKTLNPASLAPTPFPTGTPTVTITYSPSTSAPKTGTPSGHPVSASPLTASPLTVNPLTVHPTSFPTAYPSKSPATATPLTANPLTVNPATASPTAFPTDFPTASPKTGHPGTRAPTKYPTLSPTPSPATISPLTGTPSKNPTTASPRTSHPVTGVPTVFPSKSPATATPLTANPLTANPATVDPTVFPTDSPTASPMTGHPGTRAPTKYPTLSPTPSPATNSPLTGTPSKNPSTTSPQTSHPITGVPTGNPVTAAPATGTPLTGTPTSHPATGTPITNEPTYIMSFKGRRGQSKPIPESNSSTSAIEKYAYKAQCCVLQIPPLRLESTIDTTSIKVSGISQCAATCNLNPGCRGMQVGFDSRNLSPKCELIMNFQKILNVTEYGQPGCTFTNEDYGSSRLSEGEGFNDGNIVVAINAANISVGTLSLLVGPSAAKTLANPPLFTPPQKSYSQYRTHQNLVSNLKSDGNGYPQRTSVKEQMSSLARHHFPHSSGIKL
ncbi:hypothetical protein AAMO2058_000761400 [Amorphochlora amoebiformis]